MFCAVQTLEEVLCEANSRIQEYLFLCPNVRLREAEYSPCLTPRIRLNQAVLSTAGVSLTSTTLNRRCILDEYALSLEIHREDQN